MDMTFLLFSAATAAFVAIDVLAVRYGADTREGFDERRPSSL